MSLLTAADRYAELKAGHFAEYHQRLEALSRPRRQEVERIHRELLIFER